MSSSMQIPAVLDLADVDTHVDSYLYGLVMTALNQSTGAFALIASQLHNTL